MGWLKNSDKKAIIALAKQVNTEAEVVTLPVIHQIVPSVVAPIIEESLSPKTSIISRDSDGKITSIKVGEKMFSITRVSGSISSIRNGKHKWKIKRNNGSILGVEVTKL